MISKSLKGKIIFPSVIILFSLAAVMTVYSSIVFYEAAAMAAADVSAEEIILERNRLIVNNILIGLFALVISIIVLLKVITNITKPVKKLIRLVSDVTRSSLNVNLEEIKKDEIALLSSDVFSLIEQLREAADNAQAASIAKSVFLANMSHEIRTPMNSIMGFSELALDDIIPDKTREYLSKILENTKGLLQIINDILDISKVESGKMELENTPFDMHELFESCRTLVLPKVVEKGIILYFYAEPSIGKMPLGDPTRLRQVLVNLISNAVNFTDTGAVKVFAKLKEKSDKSVKVYFEIKDSGIGMTQDQIDRIFDSFIQADSGTTRKFGGTRLGLTITKGIVELMGGTLAVESIPGVGSKFFFTVEFDTINVPANKVYKKKLSIDHFEKPVFEGEVLLCEDNAMNQQVICEHLSRVGLKTVVAWNGRLGLDLVRKRVLSEEKQFDLIFMDMHMPVMDGLEASTKILELNTNVPIIAMTANVMHDDKEIYRANGLHDCINKPFTSQELWKCLLKYLMPKSGGEKNKQITDNNLLEADLLYKKALQQYFLQNNQNKYSEIIQTLEEGDLKLAHRMVHNLKSNASQLGMENLRQAASDVESQLRNGINLATEEQLKILDSELSAALKELAALVEEQLESNK